MKVGRRWRHLSQPSSNMQCKSGGKRQNSSNKKRVKINKKKRANVRAYVCSTKSMYVCLHVCMVFTCVGMGVSEVQSVRDGSDKRRGRQRDVRKKNGQNKVKESEMASVTIKECACMHICTWACCAY
mmetsp:Transcript_8561/g.22920  ORF Transcript_8561/g.22920 Transcript_8561/m.22920 type:complete len:127 (-) Transcript_8561:2703-3083(-)